MVAGTIVLRIFTAKDFPFGSKFEKQTRKTKQKDEFFYHS